jgi:hypothetical protein
VAATAGTDAVGLAGAGAPVRDSGDGPRLEHAPSAPRIAAIATQTRQENFTMWLILLEALGALVVLVLIVWWTMFAGRRKGERK